MEKADVDKIGALNTNNIRKSFSVSFFMNVFLRKT